jgi:hypothetical protein
MTERVRMEMALVKGKTRVRGFKDRRTGVIRKDVMNRDYCYESKMARIE